MLDATLGAVQQGALGAAAALYNKVRLRCGLTPSLPQPNPNQGCGTTITLPLHRPRSPLTAHLSPFTQATATVGGAQSRAKAMTPEEKRAWSERGVAGLSLAATVGQVVGGRKLKVASAVTSAAIGCCGSSASSASSSSAAASTETQTVEVLATEELSLTLTLTLFLPLTLTQTLTRLR